MSQDDRADLFDLFWENSKLNAASMQRFGERISRFEAHQRHPLPLEYATPDLQLEFPADRLFREMQARRSQRAFRNEALTRKQLGSLFAAFATSEGALYSFPSAGGLYALEVFGLLRAAEGELDGKIVYHNADNHSLSVIAKAPDDETLRELVVLDDLESLPAAIFVFVLRDLALTAKYGERGGRFTLIELGQAVQNLALRLVVERLAGVELGGFNDDLLLAALGLNPATARVGLVFACGHPQESSEAERRANRMSRAISRFIRADRG